MYRSAPSHDNCRASLKAWWLLTALCLLTGAVYWSGLSGPFLFDDYNNIVANPAIRVDGGSLDSFRQAMFAGHAGPLKRPLSMGTFAANYIFSGMTPFPFKLTNLVIHLLNGVLVFLLSRRLIGLLQTPNQAGTAVRAEHLALVTAGVWLLHPAQLTSVLYVVQRMTSLSATFVFLGLLVYLRARDLALPVKSRLVLMWLGVPLCTALAALAKENGLLLIAFAFVIEATIFRFRMRPMERWGSPTQFFALTLIVPLYSVLAFLVLQPGWLERAALNRPFTAVERLMTEARVMFLYVKILLVPSISNMALFYDDFRISRSIFDPPETVWAIAGVCGAAIAAAVLRARAPWVAFSILWFLAGHAMESTIVLLEVVHPHRNYIAYLGPILALATGGAALLSRTYTWMPRVVATVILVALAGTTALRAYQWRDPLNLAAYEVLHRPQSLRANYEMGRLLNVAAKQTHRPELNKDATRYLRRAAQLDSTDISALIGIAIANGGALKTQDLAELVRRLKGRPMSANQVSYLEALITCQRNRDCNTPPTQIQAIFSAVLAQPRLRPSVKADVLTIIGIYYAEQLGDLQAAETLMREAISLRPNEPARYINLAQVLVFVPDVAAAETALAIAEREDLLGANKSQIAQLRRDLANLDGRRNPGAEGSPAAK